MIPARAKVVLRHSGGAPLKTSIHSLRISLMRAFGRMDEATPFTPNAITEPPLRARLLSAEQMERQGRTLADSHTLFPGRAKDHLLERLADNETVLNRAYGLLVEAVQLSRRVTPAGEWLLDNFYLIEEQILMARAHFPRGYSRELPVLANGASKGLPRVYDIALAVIAHGDGRVDAESLYRFVAAYQKVSVLKLGELWAIPIMLRLALIENMRRISVRVADSLLDRNRASMWADVMVGVAEHDPKNLILVISDMARSNPPLVNSFVAELARRLQGHSSALALPLTWVEQQLSESGLTIEQMVHSETQSQAVNQVSTSNTIGSLRFLGATDWRMFVEAMSGVEHKLCEDPQGVYARMDFATRDRYRHVIEKLARRSHLCEGDLARKAIQLAHEALDQAGVTADDCRTHVGYYLIDRGLAQLERAAQVKPAPLDALRRLYRWIPLPLYLGSATLLSVGATWQLVASAASRGASVWLLVVIGLLAMLGMSQLAIALVNWCVTLMATPHALARMDYSKGIAPEARTLVVVPTMFMRLEQVDELVEALEVRFLANQDIHLHFGLLTDFRDSPRETAPEDGPLLDRAVKAIEALNAKYNSAGSERFFLFHRPRRWNPVEGIWMGYERKRGKLGDLNGLLRGGSRDAFSHIVGNTSVLQSVRYVITLDTDTQLQRDSARSFAATMAHPLNRPRYDEARERVTEGYGILQPRMAVSLTSTNSSRYASLCGNDAGIDPYTRAVSDVYQDLFQEGSFIGKGIYDVDAFEHALKYRLPENRILSHDLLEGCYARAGLISDVQLYDDYPSNYFADVSRRHRWIRGDWQIASWLWPRVPGPGATRLRNPLSGLSQWKILDNLRRSLVPAALVSLLLIGWLQPVPTLLWTLAVLGVLYIAPLAAVGLGLVRKPKNVSVRQHLTTSLRSAARQVAQATFVLACLPHEAYSSLDAILRTTVRIALTRKRVLEWMPSGSAPPVGGAGALRSSYARMWMAPVLSVAIGVILWTTHSAVLLVAAPVLALWLVAPALAWWVSCPLPERTVRLQPAQTVFLHKLARRTWRFFETFVTAHDHWLPPDNYQEQPVAVLARRTSPTNMGLALLANLAAYDFGYIPPGVLLTRTSLALASMEELDRHEGHFYNWYSTQTLMPLPPLYVSAVDSGNLSGHLLTLRVGLLGLVDQKILCTRAFEGLGDAMGNLADAATSMATPEATHSLFRLQRDIESACDVHSTKVVVVRRWLMGIAALCLSLDHPVDNASKDAAPGELAEWTHALLRQCQSTLEDLEFLLPWLALAELPQWLQHIPGLGAVPALRDLVALDAALEHAVEQHFARNGAEPPTPQETHLLAELRPLVLLATVRARERVALIQQLSQQAAVMADADYGFLYDKARHLIAVGYNVDEQRRDTGYYDLLASEARLCSFVAIAQGEVPQENWFALGRLLTGNDGRPLLLSWSGSMFEYLMPMLVMPTYANTLLDQTCRTVVERQIAYGGQCDLPWGMSESGYNTVDAALNYQYRAFGVPGLGLKRGLTDDLVVAPYASALALMVMPDAACQNLERLVGLGLQGAYGMFEAIDFTPARVPRGQTSAVVRSFMAHHQGMSLLSLAYVLLDQPMQKRFVSDPLFQATVLLLQERIPNAAVLHVSIPDLSDTRARGVGPEMPMRLLRNTDTVIPEVQLLSNGRYHVMVSQAGGGYSRWKDLAVTRWQEDATRDNWGAFFYLRDVASGELWSNAHQPTLHKADSYEAIFSEGRAEFRRRDHDYDTHTEIVVSPEDDIELRRLRITNRARTRRTIEVTSYAEVVLAPAAADALHPAFSNLFVQTEILRDRQAILCNRRARSQGEHVPWMFHLMAVHGGDTGVASYETDRMRFVGRGRSTDSPQAMNESGILSGTQGSVLDPIVAIRHHITLDPQQTVTVDVVSGIGETRDAALALIGKYRDRHLADRVFDLSWTHSWVNLQQINATESDAQLFGRLASSVIYTNPTHRAETSVLARNARGQSGLWGYGVSGDLPIVLLQIGSQDNIELVRQLVQAHAYWRLKGLAVDLVIWNEDHAGYRQLLQEQIMGLIAAGVEANYTDRPGGIFVRAAEQMSQEDRTLFQTVARVIIADTRGTLAEQVNRRSAKEKREAALLDQAVPALRPSEASRIPLSTPHDLLFFNGLGGFSADGREYIITLANGQSTPAPWVNVIANARFGTVISESGSAYTWSENAHEFRYTPWGDDPVSDHSGEAIYLRDEETGTFWSPTAWPCGSATPYVTRHGFGYSVFEHVEDGIHSELTVFVDLEASIKFSVLKIRNDGGRARKLSATGYVEWVLGDLRAKSAMHVTTEVDPTSGAILARNHYNPEFGDRIAYFDVDGATRTPHVTITGDRREFLGRNGSLRNPAAMGRTQLSNRVGAGLDACAALQVPFELAPGDTHTVSFRLGASGRRGNEANAMAQYLHEPDALQSALHAVQAYWSHILGAVQVETPDPSLDVLTNGWLLYQTIACRLWARSGFYQSGGAYGFRDQLQDTMALVHTAPHLLRQHLLRCAERQFVEGDVQHWWHPPQGRGVRTHCSDDYLWLPQATCRYVDATNDVSVLDETMAFLEGRPVNPDTDSYYDLPTRSNESASLFNHCVRAIRRALPTGAHGLPLMGSGDWNDGMNLVGIAGTGESVWLAFFLYDALVRFSPLALAHGDAAFARECLVHADVLRRSIDQHGWDGGWYRRAYFDDGTPLGSASNPEGQIDSISQSWSVLSGAGETERSRIAMEALDRRLVRRDHGLIKLLEPPFDTSALNPGYIKGYVPGVRENGGQYTHAAIWAAMAFAKQGDAQRAWECFNVINPIGHGDTLEAINTYKVEPYVVAADVYAVAPHEGRGGWTWYTGSASWMYRLVLESLLGLRLESGQLRFAPCTPVQWPGFKVKYRFGQTQYAIAVTQIGAQPGGPPTGIVVVVDGVTQRTAAVDLVDDQQDHVVEVRMTRV